MFVYRMKSVSHSCDDWTFFIFKITFCEFNQLPWINCCCCCLYVFNALSWDTYLASQRGNKPLWIKENLSIFNFSYLPKQDQMWKRGRERYLVHWLLWSIIYIWRYETIMSLLLSRKSPSLYTPLSPKENEL